MQYKLSQELAEAISKFAARRPKLKNPNFVAGKCQQYSAALADYLIANGLLQPNYQNPNWEICEIVFENSGNICKYYPRTWPTNHYVLRIKKVIVDLTARQFHPEAPIPLILPPHRNSTWNLELKRDIRALLKTIPDYAEVVLCPYAYPHRPKLLAIASFQTKRIAPKGTGTKILEEICKLADKHQICLTLDTAAKSKVRGEWKGTTSTARLQRLYKKFGFEHHHPNEPYGGSMHRDPM